MLWRYLHVARYYNNMDGLLRARFAYPNIEFRHVIAPSSDLPDSMWPLVSYIPALPIYDYLPPILFA